MEEAPQEEATFHEIPSLKHSMDLILMENMHFHCPSIFLTGRSKLLIQRRWDVNMSGPGACSE